MITLRHYHYMWVIAGLILIIFYLSINKNRPVTIVQISNSAPSISTTTSAPISTSSSSSTSTTTTTTTPTPPSESKPASACSVIFSNVLGKWLSTYRKCLVDHSKSQNRTYWAHLYIGVEKCFGEATWRMLEVHALGNMDDVKFAILNPKDPKADQCVEVTLGIGADIESEKKLRNIAPNCKFYGADPVLESGQLFRELGTFFEVAVSGQAGTLKASVMHGTNRTAYSWKNVTTVTLVDFLVNYVKVRKVDYMFIDSEGSEYSMLWQFLKGGIIEREKISICQVSIELHGPWEAYGINGTVYENLISALIDKSAYVPFWSAPSQYHARAYYVNLEDQYCVDKFFLSRFCT